MTANILKWLCQIADSPLEVVYPPSEEKRPVLLELVRYIQLNPLHAKTVKSQTEFDKYPYSGHSALMGKVKREFQDTDYVLRLFGEKLPAARKAYRAYVEKGIAQGRRPELVGGGLIRSAGGWSVVKAMRRAKDHMRSQSTQFIVLLGSKKVRFQCHRTI